MPSPESRTENSRRVAPTGRAAISTKPASVNLTALVARLSSTRPSARAWPMRRSGTGWTSWTSSRFSSASGSTMPRTELRISTTEKGWGPRSSSRSPQLAALAIGDGTVFRVLQRFRQEQDRGERGAQVVRHLDHELLPIRPRQARRQVLRLGLDLWNRSGRRRLPLEPFGGARLHACAPLGLRG